MLPPDSQRLRIGDRIMHGKRFHPVFRFAIYVAVIASLGISTLERDAALVRNFQTILFSILIEALPFILVGSLISGLIEVYVPKETIDRLMPKNAFLSVLAGA